MTGNKKRLKGEGSFKVRKDGRIEYRVMINGSRKSFYGNTEFEAKRAMNAFVKEQSELAKKKNLGGEEFLEDTILTWLNNVKRYELKPSSYDRLESIVRNKVVPAIGYYTLNDIDEDVLQVELINYYADKEASYSSIKKIYDSANAFLKWCVLTRKIQYNPMDGVSKITASNYAKKEIVPLTDEEIDKIKEVVPKLFSTGRLMYTNGYAILLAIYTGLRSGELLALRWEDFDEKHKFLKVERNMVVVKDHDGTSDRNYKTIIQPHLKSTDSRRILPLDQDAFSVIMELQKIKGDAKPSDYIVGNKQGGLWKPYYFQKMLDSVLEQSDVPHKSIHDLRHTYATRMIMRGEDIKRVSLLMGHSSVKITYDTYVHFINLGAIIRDNKHVEQDTEARA